MTSKIERPFKERSYIKCMTSTKDYDVKIVNSLHGNPAFSRTCHLRKYEISRHTCIRNNDILRP